MAPEVGGGRINYDDYYDNDNGDNHGDADDDDDDDDDDSNDDGAKFSQVESHLAKFS